MRRLYAGLLVALLATTLGFFAGPSAQATGGPGGGTGGSVGIGDDDPGTSTGPGGGVRIEPPDPYTEYAYTPTCLSNSHLPDDEGIFQAGGDALCSGATMSCQTRGDIRYYVFSRERWQDGRRGDWERNGMRCIGREEPAPQVDPEVAARMVYAQMDFAKVQIGMVPEEGAGRLGLVGMPAWMWVENDGAATVGPQDVTETMMGLSVTINAKMTGITWNMGDGTSVTCEGAGTPYSDSAGANDSPDCGHRYTKPGTYTVTATPNWEIAWSVARTGASGTFPNPVPASQRQVRVGELQVLNRQ